MSLGSNRVLSIVGFGFLFLATGPLIGCGSADPADGELKTVSRCTSDFEASVRQGPSAPLTLRGTLNLTGDTEGAIGFMVPMGTSTQVPVNAQFIGSEIALRFHLADGSVIKGQGPAGSTLAQCTGQMTGNLSGPKAGDSGDWIAYNIAANFACQSRCYFHPPIPNSCRNLCLIYGYNDGSNAYNNCYEDCVSGPAVYRCDTVTAFFDPCTFP